MFPYPEGFVAIDKELKVRRVANFGTWFGAKTVFYVQELYEWMNLLMKVRKRMYIYIYLRYSKILAGESPLAQGKNQTSLTSHTDRNDRIIRSQRRNQRALITIKHLPVPSLSKPGHKLRH